MPRVFPRLLVATEFPPAAPGGGPAVVRQMLKFWPKERLAWWSCLPETADSEGDGLATAAHSIAGIHAKLYPHARLIRQKALIIEHIWKRYAAASLRRIIERVRPEAIWTIPHQWSILPLADVLPAIIQSYHVSVHDYPAHHQQDKFSKRTISRLFGGLERIYKCSTSRDVISDQMAADLHKRTGCKPDHIFNAGVEPEEFQYLEGLQSNEHSVIRIAHAGTIIAESTFIKLVDSLGRVRRSLPKRVELHLFGAHSYRSRPWFDSNWMVEHGNLTQKDFECQLRDCHWGLSIMDLTDENPFYNRYSLPSKTVRYLAAGLPVFSIGHHRSNIINFSAKYQVGMSIDETQLDRIDELLSTELSVGNPWNRYKPAILRCARERFDAAAMRAQLYELFSVRSTT